MKSYPLINNIVGWIVFAVASLVYLFTMEPTVSFWDCGEFISAAYKLQVVHPPGAPMFLMIGRLFTMFASGPEDVAYMMNALSAFSSSFCVLFLFWTITAIAKKIMITRDESPDLGNVIAVMGAGVVGAMSCCFADSIWFSAVEGEVYALSSFFTALVVWAIFKWENQANGPLANRWLVFIAFMMGISIGVHLLNLLTIPALAFVYYYKKHKFSSLGFVVTGVVSVLILGFIQVGVIQKIPELITGFELFFTNTLGMPFNSGSTAVVFLLIFIIVGGVYWTHQSKDKINSDSNFLYRFGIDAKNINVAILCLGMIFIGYSAYFMVVIRSMANPAIDMNNPQEPYNLLSYLQREQYGSSPILYGHYYTAQQSGKKEVGEKYYQGQNEDGDDEYFFKSTKYEPTYEGKMGFFPRMHSAQDKHKRAYRNIINPTFEVHDYNGNVLKKFKKIKSAKAYVQSNPGQGLRIVDQFSFLDNLYFFFEYQIGWMYHRYFMWNFSGRQNDMQGHSSNTEGNWITGFDWFDSNILGLVPESVLPENEQGNKGHNRFFLLPFILGVIGVFYHFNNRKDDAFIVFLLWFFTGIAIVIFLNQYPFQPRERDYAFAGSIYAFCIWIGIGVLGVYEAISRYLNKRIPASLIATVLCFVAVPFLMGFDGWDDHDRSNRYTARDFAINYLESCEPNAILFTQGDNDTYPLWYAQEVEGIRTDVRIVNLSLLAVDWYIDYLKLAINDTEPVPFSLRQDQYRGDNRDIVIHRGAKLSNKALTKEIKEKGFPLKSTMKYILSEDKNRKIRASEDTWYSTFPFKKLRVDVDRKSVEENNVLSGDEWGKFDSVMTWSVGKRMLYKNDLMVLDLINQNKWKRPIYFAVSVASDAYVGLEKFFRLEGLTYRVVPVSTRNNEGFYGYVDTERMYDNLMNKFKFGGIDAEDDIYLDEGILRMALNLRIQYSRLAQALIEKNELEKAKKVLNRCLDVLPEKNVPYNMIMMQYISLYYEVGENEKAQSIALKMIENLEQKTAFYNRVSEDYEGNLRHYKDDYRQNGAIAQNIMRNIQVYDKEFAKEVKPRLEESLIQLQMLGQKIFAQ